jgi:hypothetical protein
MAEIAAALRVGLAAKPGERTERQAATLSDAPG